MTTFLLPTSSPDENFDECNYAIVHIDKKELKRIDKLVAAACKLRRTYSNLVKMSFWDDVTFHNLNDSAIHTIKKECVFRMVDDVIVLEEGSILPPGTNIRTDCDQMCIHPNKRKGNSCISWLSYAHYDSTRIQSESLSFEVLSNLVLRKNKRR
jgi:hypothetical protein